ncbi:uncharacterized protein METZ01_LOCUS321005 [marine metagenome]|uniref:Uncharacterized protein n=1 Tax=marine metagenome TaxID=408172 RepID=A0A382P8I1_9ZZZZ
MKLLVLTQRPLSWKDVPHPLQFLFAENRLMFPPQKPHLAILIAILDCF